MDVNMDMDMDEGTRADAGTSTGARRAIDTTDEVRE